MIFDKEHPVLKNAQKYMEKHKLNFEVLGAFHVSEDKYRILGKRNKPIYPDYEYVVWSSWYNNRSELYHGDYDLTKETALGILAQGVNYGEDLKLANKRLHDVIIVLLRDNYLEYESPYDKDFIEYVCNAIGITEEEYKEIMK